MTFTGTKYQIQQLLFNLDKETIYDIKIEKHRNKRGLKANNYAWELMTQISTKMIRTKEEIYLQMLNDYGVFKTNEAGEIIVAYFDKDADLKGIGSYWKFIEYAIVNNQVKKMCYLLKGSSEYNSKEMSDFIKGIEQEAKSLDIKTLSEIEFENLIKEMEKNE